VEPKETRFEKESGVEDFGMPAVGGLKAPDAGDDKGVDLPDNVGAGVDWIEA
jgi:hypothetical protein